MLLVFLVLSSLLFAIFSLYKRDLYRAETIPDQQAEQLQTKLTHTLEKIENSSLLVSRLLGFDLNETAPIRDIVINDSVILEMVFYDTNQNIKLVVSKPTVNMADFPAYKNNDKEFFDLAISGMDVLNTTDFSEDQIPLAFWFFPVKSPSGEILGVLKTTVDFSDFWSIIAQNKIGTAFIVDEHGSLLVSPDFQNAGSAESAQNKKGSVAAFLAKNPGVFKYKNNQGRTVYGTWKKLDPSNWAVISEVPTNFLFKETYVSLAAFAFFLVAVFLVIFTQVMELNKRIFRPVAVLQAGAKRLGEGKFETRIRTHANNELDNVASTFNDMAKTLAQFYQDLEKKVQQKTRALSHKVDELAEQKATDEALLESIGEGMIALDKSGMVVAVNSKAKSLLELNDDCIGKPFHELWQIEDATGKMVSLKNRPIYKSIHSGKKIETTILDHHFYALPSGKKVPIALTISPVIKNSETIGAISILRDISKEQKIDLMKTEFISLASHQLRTPLSAIKWFTEMLLAGDAGKLTKDQTEFAQNISASTERMILLVNSLLNISRIESGRMIIEPVPTDLGELVKIVVSDLKVKIAEKKLNLVISVHPNLSKIKLDPKLISQVYMNLLTNAIKYTPENGTIEVIISSNGKEIISQISDSGYGIPIAEQDKVFDKFYRGSNIIKVETDGTGLGLYLIKAIIDSSGGKIWFESEEKKGTSFWFSIPMSGMKAHKGEVQIDAPNALSHD